MSPAWQADSLPLSQSNYTQIKNMPSVNTSLECIYMLTFKTWDFPGGSADKESACNEGDLGLIPGLGRSLGEGKGYTLENSIDCIVHGLAKSQTLLNNFHFTSLLSQLLQNQWAVLTKRVYCPKFLPADERPITTFWS